MNIVVNCRMDSWNFKAVFFLTSVSVKFDTFIMTNFHEICQLSLQQTTALLKVIQYLRRSNCIGSIAKPSDLVFVSYHLHKRCSYKQWFDCILTQAFLELEKLQKLYLILSGLEHVSQSIWSIQILQVLLHFRSRT